jgi:hypothetical protein
MDPLHSEYYLLRIINIPRQYYNTQQQKDPSIALGLASTASLLGSSRWCYRTRGLSRVYNIVEIGSRLSPVE